MYPIRFENLYFEKIWGGRDFKAIRDNLPEGNIGESWDIACHRHGVSIVINGYLKGQTLQEIIEEYGHDLVGSKVGVEKFPLLVKLINSREKLSVQVHPGDEYAMKNENELGKTEAWYVIDAKPNAKLIVGTKNCTKKEFEKAIEENDAEKIHYYTNKINASIQKKLNYETIVNECNSRLEACIDQISDFSEKIKIEENINVAKKEKNRILEFFNKLIKNLNRKKNFENYVLKPSENHIERLTDEVDKSIGNLYNQIFEFAVQMKDNKDKINMAFNAMMQG